MVREIGVSVGAGEAPAAAVTDLRLKFSAEDPFVFKDLSITIHKGEKVLLLGPSGCGKSTLMQVLCGIIPDIVEVPMRCKEQVVPEAWGFVFQDPDTQFCMPYVDEELAFVLENLGVPREEMEPRIKEVLQEVGLQLTGIHVPIDSLSQGMKQRLALASVLLLGPDVLFLDEPSALLDPEGRKQIWDSVRAAGEGRTVVIVEHRIEEIFAYVDRVILFGPGGSIVGEGRPEKVFAQYRKELQDYGVWYPGIWEDYLSSTRGMKVFGSVGEAEEARDADLCRGEEVVTPTNEVLRLRAFTGLRGRQPVIEVDGAAVYPGDFIAVTGPNGAGKSSLLLSLMSLIPSVGTYLLLGQPAGWSGRRKDRWKSVPGCIGFVFQNPEFQFIADTAADEIMASLKYETAKTQVQNEGKSSSADVVLRQFGLEGLGGRHPYHLSLGQKRRLSVATAMVWRKPLLLLDEPTFGQDAVNTFAILELCESLRGQGTAILMVTHEEWISEAIATRRWIISEGRLTSQGITRRGDLMGISPDGRQRGNISPNRERADLRTPSGFMDVPKEDKQ
ncbi:ABC transporter ATP-binding protein [Paenibacillus tuaregi]|uniref:ABC transporter ATP-binding protein n=1 Tax=Paenibacillus tuaregi TaxID=1816681 RepID=UPI0008389AE4|nr:ATP-binding cassette domain-containing protein [Paenibacillus tuaregi]